MSEVFELSGRSYQFFTESEIDTFGDLLDRAEQRLRDAPPVCQDDMGPPLQELLQFWDDIQVNSIYGARIAALNVDAPERYAGGSWLTAEASIALKAVVDRWSAAERSCEDLEDPSRWVSDPSEPVDPIFEENPLAINPARSSSVGPSTLLIGLAVFATVLGGVWLITKGKKR